MSRDEVIIWLSGFGIGVFVAWLNLEVAALVGAAFGVSAAVMVVVAWWRQRKRYEQTTVHLYDDEEEGMRTSGKPRS